MLAGGISALFIMVKPPFLLILLVHREGVLKYYKCHLLLFTLNTPPHLELPPGQVSRNSWVYLAFILVKTSREATQKLQPQPRDLCIASNSELLGQAVGSESSRAPSVPQSSPKAGETAVLEGRGGSGFLSESCFPTALKGAPRNTRSLMHTLRPQGSHVTGTTFLRRSVCVCTHTLNLHTHTHTVSSLPLDTQGSHVCTPCFILPKHLKNPLKYT